MALPVKTNDARRPTAAGNFKTWLLSTIVAVLLLCNIWQFMNHHNGWAELKEAAWEHLHFRDHHVVRRSDTEEVHVSAMERSSVEARPQAGQEVGARVEPVERGLSGTVPQASRPAEGAAVPEGWGSGGRERTADEPDAVRNIPPGATVWVTFTNGAAKYIDLMLNWAAAMKRLDLPYFVVAFDDVALAACEQRGIPVIQHNTTLSSGDFRAQFKEFRKMGSQKPKMVKLFLELYGFGAVVLSDTDVVWLRSPLTFLQQHPAADVFVSTDCLSHDIEAEMDLEVRKQMFRGRCGHVPGDTWGTALNTGMLVFRNRPAALRFLEDWYQMLSDPSQSKAGQLQVTDQLAFNILMNKDAFPLQPADPQEPRTVLMAQKQVKVMPLPVLQFCNGHVAFYQHLPERHGAAPYAVHATFQRQHTAGKRARFHEQGWWLIEQPNYYTEGRFLSYSNNVMDFVRQYADGLPDLHKHLLAGAYQIAVFRDALAMAQALGRTLVLPRFMCWCDQDWYASVVQRCAMMASDIMTPYVCPSDIFLNVANLDSGLGPGQYRFPSFLDHTSPVPREVKASRSSLVVRHKRQSAGDGPQNDAAAAGDGQPRSVLLGTTARQLVAALQGTEHVRVLEVQGLMPGTFGGFEDADANSRLDGLMHSIAGTPESKWCCSDENHNKRPEMITDPSHFSWAYGLPTNLAHGGASTPWVITQWERPSWCDSDADQRFRGWDNHPCYFLTNTTLPPITLEESGRF